MEVLRDQIEDVLLMSGLDGEIAIKEDYSGRGMYGDTCFGIVCDITDFAIFCASVGSFMDDWDWLGRVRTDNMGLSTIWYWPGVKLVEEESHAG